MIDESDKKTFQHRNPTFFLDFKSNFQVYSLKYCIRRSWKTFASRDLLTFTPSMVVFEVYYNLALRLTGVKLSSE